MLTQKQLATKRKAKEIKRKAKRNGIWLAKVSLLKGRKERAKKDAILRYLSQHPEIAKSVGNIK
jgi:hypothetical protein